ncbi:MAG: hypothetical protein M3P99_06180, partial [Pseudomonadota bacterium]|nr:hypothetical protein [Pseudomonadota bacterium]
LPYGVLVIVNDDDARSWTRMHRLRSGPRERGERAHVGRVTDLQCGREQYVTPLHCLSYA